MILKSFIKYKLINFKLKKRKSKIIHPLSITWRKYLYIGKNTKIFNNCRLECYREYENKSYDASIKIGDDCIIGYYCSILSAGKIEIGNGCIFAQNCLITNENHGIQVNDQYFYKQELNVKDVRIGNNVWLGQNCVVLPGVTIGDNVIVGSSSVVSKSIPSNSIAVGNPAKVIRVWNFEKGGWVSI